MTSSITTSGNPSSCVIHWSAWPCWSIYTTLNSTICLTSMQPSEPKASLNTLVANGLCLNGEFKCHLRSLECKSKSPSLTIDKEIHAGKFKEYDALRSKTKQLNDINAVLDCAGNQGTVSSIINHLLHCTASMPLPEAESN